MMIAQRAWKVVVVDGDVDGCGAYVMKDAKAEIGPSSGQ